jgi:hypothetical protein
MPADLHHRPSIDPALRRRLHRWVAASLLTPEEADAIEAFEAAAVRERPAGPRGVPPLTEALVYVGAALAAAAAAVLLGDRWEDLTPVVRSTAVGVAALLAFVAGLLLHRSDDPALIRITSLAWLAAVGLSGWLAWLIAYDVLDLRGRVPALASGVTITLVGAALYAIQRRALQQVAMCIGLLIVAGAAFAEGRAAAAVAVWAVAVAWTVVGALGLLPPASAALLGGPVVAIWAPLALTGSPVGIWLGLCTATGLLVAGVIMRESLLLGLGAFGVFVAVMRVLVRYFGGTRAMPVVLLVAGAIVLILAIAYARRSGRTSTRPAPRSPS